MKLFLELTPVYGEPVEAESRNFCQYKWWVNGRPGIPDRPVTAGKYLRD